MEGLNYRYLDFPVSLLKGFLKDPFTAVQKIFMYCLYRDISVEECYRNLQTAEKELMIRVRDIDLCAKSIEDTGGELHREYGGDGVPYVGADVNRLMDVIHYEPESLNVAAFVAFLALKSILQNQAYKKVGIDYWFSRMDGFKKSVPRDQLSPEVAKWATRWKREKLTQHLEQYYRLIRPYGKHRGIIFSFSNQRLKDGYMTGERLEWHVQTKKTGYRTNTLKE